MSTYRFHPIYLETFRDASYTRSRWLYYRALRFTSSNPRWNHRQVTAHAKRLGVYQALRANCRLSEPVVMPPTHMSYAQFRAHVLQSE